MIKATTFLITALITLGIGMGLFFMLMMSLDGLTGEQADPSLILFIVWVLLASIIAGVLGFLTANYLITKKSFKPGRAALLAIGIFVIVGTVANIVGFIAAVVLTSAM